MGYPRHQRSRDFKFFTRGAGNLTLNSTAWVVLPTIGTTFDITLVAQTGDVVECGVNGVWGAENVQGNLDAVSIVSAAVVSYWGGDGTSASGTGAWSGYNSINAPIGGSVMRTLISGDVTAGSVTVRLLYRTSTAANKTLFANTGNSFQFWAKNLGPQDPN